jgi:DNA (cytosine-5)-methyltransferase 3A
MGVKVNKYYACEIDKHAIGITKFQFPETIHLGDVRDLDVSQLPRIDLLLGGSPCTSISMAGKQEGIGTGSLETYLKLKEEGFQFEGQSFLFWEYIRIRKELMGLNPNLKWLLENVKMKKDFKRVFDEVAGGDCIEINSALVSAQNRVRNYWHNFGNVSQPEDKGILLKDILEAGVVDTSTVTGCRQVGRKLSEDGKRDDYNPSIKAEQRIELREDRKAGCITTVQKDSMVAYERDEEGVVYRKLTPIECERLQTAPDQYTAKEIVLKQKKKKGEVVSEEWVLQDTPKTHRYKCLGNGWTVDVIVHILKYAKLGE